MMRSNGASMNGDTETDLCPEGIRALSDGLLVMFLVVLDSRADMRLWASILALHPTGDGRHLDMRNNVGWGCWLGRS